MESQYVITETSRRFEGLAADILKAEFDIRKEQVGLGIPKESSPFALCIFLYDLQKNANINSVQFRAVSVGELRYPSSYYDLFYMLVPYSNGDMKYRAEEEFRMLDILLKKLGDTSFLEENKQTAVTIVNPDFEEKIKIWNALSQPLRLALYCKLGPVEVVSGRTKKMKRVKDVEMHFIDK